MTHDNPDTDLADDVTDSLVDYEHLRERNDVRYQERRDVVDPAVVDDVAALPDMAGVGITNDDGELLFRRLTDTCEWKIPVVNVDPGEDFAVAISDHVRETIGFEIELAAVETVREITLESEDGERTASRAFVTFSGLYYRTFLTFLPDLLGDDVPGYVDVGLDAVGSYSEPADWLTYELTHLLVAELAWDTDLTTDGYVQRYLHERYGPAADAVGTYLLAVEDAGRTLFDSFDGRLDDPEAVAAATERYERAQDVLADARESAAPDSDEAFLLDRLLGNLDYALADVELAAATIEGDRTAEAVAKQRFEEAMVAERFAGTVLQCRFPINRYTDLQVPSSSRWNVGIYREEW